MRKIMWFTIAFGAACAVGTYLLPALVLVILGAVFLAAGVALRFLTEKQWLRIAAMVCTGLSVGMLWYSAYDAMFLAPVRELDGQVMPVILQAEDYSFEANYGICVDGTAELNGRTCRVRMYVNQWEPLNPGDQVSGDFRLRYTAPGGLEDATFHSGKGILLLAYPKGEHSVVKQEDEPLRYTAAYLRADILTLIDGIFPEDAIPFARALLLGDTSRLDYKTDSDLSVSGLRHVVAVSGLHVSILFSLIYMFTGRHGIRAGIPGIPLLVLFAAMAGFSPSVLRAAIMQILMLLSMMTRKEYDPPTSLASAVLVMLAVNPLTVTSVGFQLSVASVSGIILFSGRISGWMHSKVKFKEKNGTPATLYKKLTTSVSVSLGALIATTPLTAWHFGSVSLFSVATNLLCLWVITIVFCGIIAACLLGALWLPLGKVAAWILAWPIRYVLGIASFVAEIPLSAVYTESVFVVIWLVLAYVLLVVMLLAKKKRILLTSCAVILSLCVSLLLSWTLPLLDHYRVTVLDVGQGQCILLQNQGKTYMVDCGGSYDEDTADTAAEMLLSQGICRLDGLILTHYDKDHVGAAHYLLQRIPADLLVLPEGEGAENWDPLLREVHTGTTIRAVENMDIQWGDAKITVYAAWTTQTSNESSLCVLFHTEKCDILITGDRSCAGEEALLIMEKIPQLDALVIGHHGAASSTAEILLAETQPKLALISVGEGNRYGHPDPQVLERLVAYGCEIRRTDLEGTIIIRG